MSEHKSTVAERAERHAGGTPVRVAEKTEEERAEFHKQTLKLLYEKSKKKS